MKFEAMLLGKKDMIIGDNIEKYEGKEINAFIYKNSENKFPNNIKYLEFKTLKNSPVIFICGYGKLTLEEYSESIDKYLVLKVDKETKELLYCAEHKMGTLGVKMELVVPEE